MLQQHTDCNIRYQQFVAIIEMFIALSASFAALQVPYCCVLTVSARQLIERNAVIKWNTVYVFVQENFMIMLINVLCCSVWTKCDDILSWFIAVKVIITEP
jgi:hypothetical protein